MESGVSIGDSLDTNGGDVAGGNIFKIILNIAQQNLPQSDPLTTKFQDKLSALNILVSTVQSWKEVHNSLDEIRSRFDQFREPIEFSNLKRRPLPFQTIKRSWRPVAGKVDLYHQRMEETNRIEPLFNSMEKRRRDDRQDDVKIWSRKSLEVIEICHDLNRHLGLTENPDYVFSDSQFELILIEIQWKIGFTQTWWKILYDTSDELNNKLAESMYLADKVLRATADQLCREMQE